jgi:sugar phosphate isomerase/epimerase
MDDTAVKLALCNEMFGDRDQEAVFATIAESGFQGVEIAPFTLAEKASDITLERRDELVRAAERNGIQIIGLHWLLVTPKGLHITTPDAAVRRRSFDYLCELVNLAGDLGGEALVLGSPKQRSLMPGQDRDEAMHNVAQGMRRVGEVAEKRGIRFCLEALHPDETNFLNTVEDVVELLSLIDSPGIRYMLDVKAMSGMPGSIVDRVLRYGRDAGHVHVNEPSGLGPGMGGFSFDEVMKAIQTSGFPHWVSVEPFDYKPDPETVGRTAFKTLKAALAA